MRKNGFTLVEIISILVVLAMIMLIVLPNLLSTLNKTEEKNYEEFIKSLNLASELYVEKNSNLYNLANSGDEAVILLGYLIDDGLVNYKIVNPKTEERIHREDKIRIVVQSDLRRIYTFELYGG